MKPGQISLTSEMRRVLVTDRDAQIYVAQEIGQAVITVYQWAKYYPERLAKRPAAMKALLAYIIETETATALVEV